VKEDRDDLEVDTLCTRCGEPIADVKTALRREGEIYGCDVCATATTGMVGCDRCAAAVPTEAEPPVI